MRNALLALITSALLASPATADDIVSLVQDQLTLVGAISDDEAEFKARIAERAHGFIEAAKYSESASGDWDVGYVWTETPFGDMTLSCTRLGIETLEAASGPKLADVESTFVLEARRLKRWISVINPKAGNEFPRGAVRSLLCYTTVNGAGLVVPDLAALRAVLSPNFGTIEQSSIAARSAPNRTYFAYDGALDGNIWFYAFKFDAIYLNRIGPDRSPPFITFGFVAFEMALSG